MLYKLTTGNAPMRLLSTDIVTKTARCRYVKSHIEVEVPIRKLEPYTDQHYPDIGETAEENEMMRMKQTTLYRVLGNETYGTLLATNSQGQLVLEMAGTGEVKAFNKTDVEKVMPFTFSIMFAGTDPKAKTYDYLGTVGAVSPGDLLLHDNGSFCHVVKVDTKSTIATKKFSGWKIPTTRVGDETDEDDDSL